MQVTKISTSKNLPGKNTTLTSLQTGICLQRFNDATHPSVIQIFLKNLLKNYRGEELYIRKSKLRRKANESLQEYQKLNCMTDTVI